MSRITVEHVVWVVRRDATDRPADAAQAEYYRQELSDIRALA